MDKGAKAELQGLMEKKKKYNDELVVANEAGDRRRVDLLENQIRTSDINIKHRKMAIRMAARAKQIQSRRVSRSGTDLIFEAGEDITVHDSLSATGLSPVRKRSNQTLLTGSKFILDQNNVVERRDNGTPMIHIEEQGTENPIRGYIKIDKSTSPPLSENVTGLEGGGKKRRRRKKTMRKKKTMRRKKRKKKKSRRN